MSERSTDSSMGQFIDPMFAVMIAAAVGETILVWVKQGDIPGFFTLMSVIIGYVNLLLSWFGYHKSVLKKPILGSLRFIVTVILLPLYLLTIVLTTKPFYCVALTYAAIFFLWSFWEYLKYREHLIEQGFLSLQFRLYNVMTYVAAIYVVMAEFIPASSVPILPAWLFSLANPLGLTIIGCAIVVLRAQKSSKNSDTPISKIIGQIKILLFGSHADS